MKILRINDNDLLFDNGILMQVTHVQDEYERHWADFNFLKSYHRHPKTGESMSIYHIEFPSTVHDLQNSMQLMEDNGFYLIALDGSKYFVPCCGENDGYCSINLTLHITDDNAGKEIAIDLSDYQSIVIVDDDDDDDDDWFI